MTETDFIRSALEDGHAIWRKPMLDRLSSLHLSDGVLGRRRALLCADIHEQWARWFVEGVADPYRYTGRNASYPYLFRDVFAVVDKRFRDFTRPEKQELASISARVLQRLVAALEADRRRRVVPRNERSLLIDLAGDPARCWICGEQFSQEAIDSFLSAQPLEGPLPAFVDVLKPRGRLEKPMVLSGLV